GARRGSHHAGGRVRRAGAARRRPGGLRPHGSRAAAGRHRQVRRRAGGSRHARRRHRRGARHHRGGLRALPDPGGLPRPHAEGTRGHGACVRPLRAPRSGSGRAGPAAVGASSWHGPSRTPSRCPPRAGKGRALPPDGRFGLEFPRMAVVLPDPAEELRSELSDLIVRRLRIGLRAFLAGVVLFVVADHSLLAATPRWADVLNAVLIVFATVALGLSGRPVFRAHAVLFALLTVAVICGTRALAGIWTGDLVPTAIVCLVVALTAGTSLPWGAWPQLPSAATAGLSIASNAYLISAPSPHATAQLVAAVFTALMVSVVLSFELQRNHRRLVEENIRRRRAEDGLARLN